MVLGFRKNFEYYIINEHNHNDHDNVDDYHNDYYHYFNHYVN